MRCIHGVKYNKTIQNTIVQNTDCLKVVPGKKDESIQVLGSRRRRKRNEGKNLFLVRPRFQGNYF